MGFQHANFSGNLLYFLMSSRLNQDINFHGTKFYCHHIHEHRIRAVGKRVCPTLPNFLLFTSPIFLDYPITVKDFTAAFSAPGKKTVITDNGARSAFRLAAGNSF